MGDIVVSLVQFLSVWLHVFAVLVWVGGMAFLSVVLVPVLRRAAPERLSELVKLTGERFRIVGWLCLGVLVVSGAFNLYARGIRLAHLHSPEFWETSWGHVLAVKLLLVVGLLGLSAVHDFVVGPRASAGRGGTSLARWMGRTTLLVALVTVVCGMMLVRGCPH